MGEVAKQEVEVNTVSRKSKGGVMVVEVAVREPEYNL